MPIIPLVAGNWKMNGSRLSGVQEISAMKLSAKELKGKVDLLICPPSHLIYALKGKGVALGAQDCHEKESGAYTGNISAKMLKEVGAKAIIVGHSERRQYHGETDELVCEKALAAQNAGLQAIICVGETLEQRQKGETLHVIARQLARSVPNASTARNTIIAYEPVWAIGSGLTPSLKDIEEVHTLMRKDLVKRFKTQGKTMRLLYGGSVKPSNAKELMGVANVNGALVGGASLTAKDFLAIADAYR